MNPIRPQKILITGFEPFGAEHINPAMLAVQALAVEVEQVVIIKKQLPTAFDRSLEVLQQAIEQEHPDVVICVGQAGGRYRISLEVVAINLDDAPIPDNAGQQPRDRKIKAQGANAYFSTLPNKAIVSQLIAHQIPASLSYTAGTYVCNHVFYGLCYLIETKYPTIKGGFIHVPFLPEQVLDKSDKPAMSLDQITKALALAVQVVATTTTDIHNQGGIIH